MQTNQPTSLSKSANEFAIELFQCYLRRHDYRNLLLCPYLIYHSLAMMLVGAKGNTADQLLAMLRIPSQESALCHKSSSQRRGQKARSPTKAPTAPPDSAKPKSLGSMTPNGSDNSRHKEFLWLSEQLIHGNHDFVHQASFIYLDKGTKRTERYKNILRDYYETKPKKIDFDKVELMCKTVNEDVARTTENIYNEVLSKQEAQKLEKSYMLLVNAAFFRGFWLSNFTDVKRAPFYATAPPASADNKATAKAPSGAGQPDLQRPQQPPASNNKHNTTGELVQVNMMSKLDYLPVVSDEQMDARIVLMPFEASDLQMMLILPNDKQRDPTYLCDKISAQRVEHIIDQFSRSKSKTVRICMPIFCIDSGKISLQSTLVKMGASDLFDRNKANMSGVCENKHIWLHKIIHRCFIVCDNRGSITSSAFEKARKRQSKLESGISSGRSGVDEFLADHPFMYIIVDSITRAILLIGLYTDPAATLEVIHEDQLSPEEAHQIYTEGVYKT